MDINTFIEKTAGSWFSQRTTYNINKEAVDNSKANLNINLLEQNSDQAKAIYQQNDITQKIILSSLPIGITPPTGENPKKLVIAP